MKREISFCCLPMRGAYFVLRVRDNYVNIIRDYSFPVMSNGQTITKTQAD